MPNIPPAVSEGLMLPNAPAMALSPAEFAASRVGNISTFLGGVLGPLAALGLTFIGIKAIITGKNPLSKEK